MLPRSWGHLEDLIVLARAVGHLDGDLVAGFRQRDLQMVHFHRGDLLGEVGRMAVKANVVADRERALGHAHDGDTWSLEVVDDGPDQLFRHRSSSRASPTTISSARSGAANASPRTVSLSLAPRVILALDADEILAANALDTPSWRAMLDARPGTIVCFERVDLYETPDQCMRHDRLTPLGYVDDGVEHAPRDMHSVRVPIPDYARRLLLDEIAVLHYSALRPAALAAKLRWYSVLENVRGTCPWVFKRRLRYATHVDFTGAGRLEPSRAEWFRGWEDAGIDMRTVTQERYHWYDFEVLRYFKEHGARKFWLDDIWRFDWEACRLHAKRHNIAGAPEAPVDAPPRALVGAMRVLSALHRIQRRVRHRLTG